jgi:hypothetical protein
VQHICYHSGLHHLTHLLTAFRAQVFLYDEADIELADQFFTNGSPIRPGGPATPPVFADDSEVTVRDFIVQIQRFQKVTRTVSGVSLEELPLAKEPAKLTTFATSYASPRISRRYCRPRS